MLKLIVLPGTEVHPPLLVDISVVNLVNVAAAVAHAAVETTHAVVVTDPSAHSMNAPPSSFNFPFKRWIPVADVTENTDVPDEVTVRLDAVNACDTSREPV